MRADDELLRYFQLELGYLRDQGADFARRHPQVAARLALGAGESPDPHTERLIEAQAFLAARVHRDLDREFPRLAALVLDELCPTLARPVPSMTVVQMRSDPAQGKVTTGLTVARHTSLQAVAASGETVRLRTAWDLTLWPVDVAAVRLVDGCALHVDLACDEGTDFAELDIERLRLHVHGDWRTATPLYETLARAVTGASVEDGDGLRQPLSARAWRAVGFADDEAVLAPSPNATGAHALLQTYFAFPRAFHFFEVDGLRGRLGRGRHARLVLHLDVAAVPPRLEVAPRSLRLGCVPAVDLFACVGEPVRIDHRRHEWLLQPDHAGAAAAEVHSVTAVTACDPQLDDASRDIPPFGAVDPGAGGGAAFWTVRREPTTRPGLRGSDVWLSFVDPAHQAVALPEPVVYARLLCTSRGLAERLPEGTPLRPENLPRALQVRTLYVPSAQRAAPMAAGSVWRLVALLRLNHGSLVDRPDGADALRAMLRLFADDGPRDAAQVHGLADVRSRPAVAWIGVDAWRGHCRGTEVDVSFDDAAFAGGSPLLLSAVLARFLALHTTTNSFVRLRVLRRREVWHTWPAMSGRQALA